MRIKKKANGQRGFTLAETLLAVLILLLVSSIVATGIPVAKNAYEKVVLAANAQLLLTTTASALRDELGTAWDVKIDDKGSYVTYYSSDTGMLSKLSAGDEGITLQEYNKTSGLHSEAEDSISSISRLLVSKEAADKKNNLVTTFTKISKSNNHIVFTGLAVKKDKTVLVSLDQPLQIEVVWAKATT